MINKTNSKVSNVTAHDLDLYFIFIFFLFFFFFILIDPLIRWSVDPFIHVSIDQFIYYFAKQTNQLSRIQTLFDQLLTVNSHR